MMAVNSCCQYLQGVPWARYNEFQAFPGVFKEFFNKDQRVQPLKGTQVIFRHGSLLCMLLNKEVYQNTCAVGERGGGAFSAPYFFL